jgi:hypothetical protein
MCSLLEIPVKIHHKLPTNQNKYYRRIEIFIAINFFHKFDHLPY